MGEDPWDGSPEEYAAAFATYIGYYGTYEVELDTVIHEVVASSFPNWRGVRHVRNADIVGDKLVLRSAPMRFAGGTIVKELHWQRVE